MELITLVGGNLFQWDIGRQVQINAPPSVTVTEVHFSTPNLPYAVVVKPKEGNEGEAVADIPDILLQHNCNLNVWPVFEDATMSKTIDAFVFKILKRQQPTDYKYIPQAFYRACTWHLQYVSDNLLTEFKAFLITLSQNGQIIISKDQTELAIDEYSVRLDLTPEETKLFTPTTNAQIQLRAVNTVGETECTPVTVLPILDVLDDTDIGGVANG